MHEDVLPHTIAGVLFTEVSCKTMFMGANDDDFHYWFSYRLVQALPVAALSVWVLQDLLIFVVFTVHLTHKKQGIIYINDIFIACFIK